MAQAKKTSHKGAGLATLGAVAAAAVGAYYFYGPKGKEHRTKAQTWMHKMQKDVAMEVKKVRELNKKAYETIVDDAAAAYARVKSVDPKEVKTLAADLKKHWAVVKADLAAASKDMKKTATRAVGAKKAKK